MRSIPRLRVLIEGVVIVGSILLAFGIAEGRRAPDVRDQEGRDTTEVLFVGNSYTYYNNLPDLVETISAALDGPVLRTQAHTHGAATLQRHLEDGHVAGLLEDGAPGGAAWDHVVLQGQSQLGTELVDATSGRLGDPAGFHAAAEALGELVYDAGSTPLLYMTWARKRFPSQISILADAYRDAGAILDAPVAPVGLAWARVRRERPDLELFQSDGTHPSAAGSYLAACVIYSALTRRPAEGAPTKIEAGRWGGSDFLARLRRLLVGDRTALVSLEADVALYLQRVAWEAVSADEIEGDTVVDSLRVSGA